MPHWLAPIRVVVLACIFAVVGILVSSTAAVSGDVSNKRLKGPTQALWVTNLGMFSVLQGRGLTHSGVAHPKLVFGNPADYAGGLAFKGDELWGAVMGDPSLRGTSFIFELTPAQLRKLVKHERVKPAIEMDDAGGAALHFDSAGNLWVATPPSDIPELVMYTPDQLVSGTAPPPARTITFVDSIGNITDFAFDSIGNLWVDTDYSRNGEEEPALSELTPDQFAASAISVVPHLQLAGVTGQALAFDSSGDLWAATDAGIYMFLPSELTGAGVQSVAPAITLGSVAVGRGGSFGDPDGLAFDAEGNLWVACSSDVGGINFGGIAEFTSDEITSSGRPQPKVVLRANRRQTNLGSPSLMTFGPRLK